MELRFMGLKKEENKEFIIFEVFWNIFFLLIYNIIIIILVF